MTHKPHEFPYRGTIQNWRTDRGYGEIKADETGTCYQAASAGNQGDALKGGVSLNGAVVRFRVRGPYQPVEWISEALAKQRAEAARLKAMEDQIAAEQRAAEQKAEAARRKELAEQRAAHEIAEAARLKELAEQRAIQAKAEAAKRQALAEQMAAQQKAEAARLNAIAAQRAAQDNAEHEEFRQLVAEMSAFGFTSSSQVSNYIVRNQLGYKYKHISGILEMELGGERWKFNGGFPPRIYARLCDELGLGNQGSRATPVAFTPYKDIYRR